jgi:adenosyl cobinamide kinase/adenosyl cobinamide phosphate guanylyltransferase/capsular polysaccharide biosynthesis protein
MASVINITMSDIVPKRAEDVINGVIDAYNADAIEDKRTISNITKEFIDERLLLLSEELNLADSDIATFKERNNITSPEEYATISIEELQRLKEQTLSLEGSLAMAEYILSQLSNEGVTSLIPASTVAMSGAAQPLATQIERYNTTLLTYERLIASSSASSPAVSDLARQIAALRQTIIASLVGHIEGLNLQIASLKGEQRLAMGRMQSVPTKEKELLSKVRGQKVKEELYIYLLAKHEENALMGAVAESNARIIDRAYGSSSPIRPRSTAIVLTALIMGILLPLAIIYLREVTNSTVRSRRDIERVLSVPFLGEIPKHNGKGGGIVVRKDSRDGVSEAFRMLRANLAYMSIGRAMQVVMLTSSIPHSGKTFVSSNLAMALATANKRVVLIDCVTLWSTNFFFDLQNEFMHSAKGASAHAERTLSELKDEFDRFTSQDATFIFVTNEIGSGGVSDNEIQRRFTDVQGWINQYIASKADEVTLMVSGIPVRVKSKS